jgi:hypothetical protein
MIKTGIEANRRPRWWPFRGKAPAQPCFSLDPYALDQLVPENLLLRPLSKAEILALKSSSDFEGEETAHCRPAIFMDRLWDVVLATVNGRIYKIALQHKDLTPTEATEMARRIIEFCSEHQRQQPKRNGRFFIWDAADGNIVLHADISSSGATVNLFLTSSAVRTFAVRNR